MFPFNQATQTFPLLKDNNLTFKAGNTFPYYHGPKPFDDTDHPHPNIQKHIQVASREPRSNPWDFQVNPVLWTGRSLMPTEEFAGPKTGQYFPMVGWVARGASRRCAIGFNRMQRYNRYKYMGKWLEINMTPRWKRAPRVGASGPRARYHGRLIYSQLQLRKLLWAIESGRLNPNEKITIFHLVEAGVVAEWECVWPGFQLTAGTLDTLNRPINIELQRATPRAISLIERAGGSFTCTYMSMQGMYEELFPEEFAVFSEQEMPDRSSFEEASTNPKARGYLSKWYDDVVKYAHPMAGRRQSHYVKPPQDRDFPATLEEYERVKHHQKWHLGQPGTGTVLPWLFERSSQRYGA